MSGVLYSVEIVEGRNEPKEWPQKDYSELGKTVGFLLRLTCYIRETSDVVVLDSDFCVLKGISELRKKGVFGAALVKKCQYWPKYIDGETIKRHFATKEVGSVDAMKGKVDGVNVEIHWLKVPDYTMMLMSSYGTLEKVGDEKSRIWSEDITTVTRETRIKYPELVYNHF